MEVDTESVGISDEKQEDILVDPVNYPLKVDGDSDVVVESAEFSGEIDHSSVIIQEFGEVSLPEEKTENLEVAQITEVGGEFTCRRCDFSSNTKEALKCHTANEHKHAFLKKYYNCKLCTFNSRTMTGLRKHMNQRHLFEYPLTDSFTCSHCGYEGATKADIKEHWVKKHAEMPEPFTDLECLFCNYEAPSKKSWHNHISAKHKGERRKHKCALCDVTETTVRALRNHTLTEHPNEKVTYEFQCSHCSYFAPSKKTLANHNSQYHKHESERQRVYCREDVCTFATYKISALREHLTDVHGLEFKLHSATFNSMEEFESWKEDLESVSKSRYVIRSRAASNTTFYQCNRSGTYKKQSKGKRNSKKPTCKMGGQCTAYIWTKLDPQTKLVQARWCAEHYGHDMELQHLRLKKSERLSLQGKLAVGAHCNSILREIQDDASSRGNPDNLDRIHLAKRSDLRNAARAIGLKLDNSKKKVEPVHILLEKLTNTKEIIVLYYKAQNTDEEDLDFEDFIVAFATPYQVHQFHDLACNTVCVDTTCGTTAHDFELTTIMVVDSCDEALPVAWMLSNRQDEIVLTRFIKSFRRVVEEETGNFPMPQWFMSDKDSMYYNAWVSSTDFMPTKLIGIWHVNNAWKSHITLIKDTAIRKNVFYTLSVIMIAREPMDAQKMLNDLTQDLIMDDVSEEFGQYLATVWQPCLHQWCLGFRKSCAIYNHVYIEAFHRMFIDQYLGDHLDNNVDRCFSALVKFSAGLSSEYTIKKQFLKEAFKQREINKRHEKSVKIASVSMLATTDEPYTWNVFCNDFCFTVNRLFIKCPLPKPCASRCDLCGNICVHAFACTCIDHVVFTTICEHIHLVATTFADYFESPQEDGIVVELMEESLEDAIETRTGNPSNEISKLQARLFVVAAQIGSLPSQHFKECDSKIYDLEQCVSKLSGLPENVKRKAQPEKKPNLAKYKRKNSCVNDIYVSVDPIPIDSGTGLFSENEHSYCSPYTLFSATPSQLRFLNAVSRSPISNKNTDDILLRDDDIRTYSRSELTEETAKLLLDAGLEQYKHFCTAEALTSIHKIINFIRAWPCNSCNKVTKGNFVVCDHCHVAFHWKCVDLPIGSVDSPWKCKVCKKWKHYTKHKH